MSKIATYLDLEAVNGFSAARRNLEATRRTIVAMLKDRNADAADREAARPLIARIDLALDALREI